MPVTSQDADPLTSRGYDSVWQLRADGYQIFTEAALTAPGPPSAR